MTRRRLTGMGDINPANPLWLLLFLAIALFGTVHVETEMERSEPPRSDRDGGDGVVSGTVSTMTENGRFAPVPSDGAAVFAVPTAFVSPFEDIEDLPDDWRDGAFTVRPESVARLRGGYAEVGRAGAFELPMHGTEREFVVCYAERAPDVAGCAETELDPDRHSRLIWTGEGLIHRSAGAN